MSQATTPEVSAPDQTAPNASTAPHASEQATLPPQSATPTAAASPAADMARDVVMSDRTPDRPAVSQAFTQSFNHLIRSSLQQ
jgi:hypothetical protein